MFFLFIFNIFVFSQSPNVLVLAEAQSPTKYHSYLKKNPQLITYIQFHRDIKKEVHIKNNLFQAQYHFLSGSLKKSQLLFGKVIDKMHSYDWMRPEREKIIYALMRSAQLESNPNKKLHWVRKTIEFDSSIRPNKDLFPPPLLKIWDSLIKVHGPRTFTLPKGSKKYSDIYINGQKIKPIHGMVTLSPGKKRITMVSNIYKPILIKIHTDNIESHSIVTNPFASGHCQAPELAHTEFSTFFNLDCVHPPGESGLPSWAHNIKTKPKIQVSNPLKSTPWYKKKEVLWLGGIIVAGLATWQYQKSQQKNPSTPPVEYQPTTQIISNTSTEN